MSDLLAICIPTYNRADKLEKSLAYHAPKLAKYGIPIYISDNASEDGTQDVVSQYSEKYGNIFYHRNYSNLGPDKNFELVLKLPENAKYAWLLGDDDYLIFEHFDALVEKLKQSSSQLVVVNTRNQVFEKLDSKYSDINKLLRDLSWHMTFISSLIFSQDAVQKAEFRSYYDAGFVHVDSVFKYLASCDSISVLWNEEEMVTTLRVDDELPSWYSRMLEIFGENWVNTIFSLPLEYSAESKIIAVKALWQKSGIVSIKGVLVLRGLGQLSIRDYEKYKKVLEFLIGAKRWWVWLICLMPVSIISPVITVLYKRYVQRRINETQIFLENVNIDNE
ncbi:glycosyltransferase family 2 protein [Hydrogenovibrio kuenenii]|uniref:glycosyltransferase family 2 protein n=1 Tax=Hydrogenovibrio kuenenii TaxID=63658 RepID=UPI000463ADB1|nr:glycosyltransferase [Hydrogenovibrio kuenenii]